MADKKLALDKQWLQDFVDHQIAPFQTSLENVAHTDDEEGVAIGTLLGKTDYLDDVEPIYKIDGQQPLPVGQLDSEGNNNITGGMGVVTAMRELCESVIDVYEKQITLFRDLHDNLNTTIETLMGAQHDNLEKVDGQIFIDSLGTLPDDFQDIGKPSQSS
jgi:hypothetical protein